MSGGRRSGRTFRTGVGSLLGAVLWAITLLSVLQWSTLSAQPGNPIQITTPAGGATLAASEGDRSGPVAYAQLPAAPAMAEKRASVSTSPSKGGPDDATVDAAEQPVPMRTASSRTGTPAAAQARRAEALGLPPTRAPPGHG